MSECNIETELNEPEHQAVLPAELIIRAEKTAEQTVENLKACSIKLALAESCTAGLVSSFLAEVPGASDVLWGSFVCYTKEAKVFMLGLNESEIEKYGLVSEETACKMAENALEKSGAEIAASVTGLAGPGGDGSKTPVGTVWIAAAVRQKTERKKYHFSGGRNEVRLRAAIAVLEMINNIIAQKV